MPFSKVQLQFLEELAADQARAIKDAIATAVAGLRAEVSETVAQVTFEIAELQREAALQKKLEAVRDKRRADQLESENRLLAAGLHPAAAREAAEAAEPPPARAHIIAGYASGSGEG